MFATRFPSSRSKMYHLPLLPGYGPGSNIRSSAPPTSTGTGNEDPSSGLSEAEEDGYQGTYFTYPSTSPRIEGYMPSASPETLTHRPSLGSGEVQNTVSPEQHLLQAEHVLSPEDSNPAISPSPSQGGPTRSKRSSRRAAAREVQNFVEAIFFEYGVVVFFGLREDQELGIVEDIEGAGIMTRPIPHDDWEVEACHYSVCILHSRLRLYVDTLPCSTTRTLHSRASTTTSSVRSLL